MAAACYLASKKISLGEAGLPEKLLGLAMLISLSVISYAVFCFIFRVREMQEAWDWLVLKKGREGK